MTKVTEKLAVMQVQVSEIETKKNNLEANARNMVEQIKATEQQLINLKTDLVRVQGAIAMCTDLLQSTENPDG
jgi:septal ring factor EnvC (AmiA/AmiB activator)